MEGLTARWPLRLIGMLIRAGRFCLEILRSLRTSLPFWWSQLLFPEQGRAQPEHNPPSAICNLQFLLLTVMAGLLCFGHLGCPLQEPEESRYAEIPRQMLEVGNFAIPLLNGQPYYDKPPLLYWCVMGSYQAFGVHDWSARLVSCAAAFLTVLLTYGWGRRVVGPRPAFLGAAMLCLSGRFIFLGRLLTMNSLLCLCVIAGLAAAHLAVRAPTLRWRWWFLSAAACGLGLLTKGPVAIALIAVPVAIYQALDQRVARPTLWMWIVYLAAAVGLACPWYAAAALRDPEFLTYFFWKHNLVRYVAPFDHAKPAWYYLGDVLLGMLPWSLLLPGLILWLARRRDSRGPGRSSDLGFFVLSALWCLVFYSLAGSKRAGYILPAMPPLALALGKYLQVGLTALRQQARERFSSRLAFRATLLTIASALLGSVWAYGTGILRPGTTVVIVAGTIIALALVYRHARRLNLEKSWMLCGAATFAILLIALYSILPAYAAHYSMRSQVLRLAELRGDTDDPIVCYPRQWDSVSFYLGRCDARIYSAEQRQELIAELRAHPETLAVIKSEHFLPALIDDLPPSLEFVPCSRPANVVIGRVQPRTEAPFSYFAQRTSDR